MPSIYRSDRGRDSIERWCSDRLDAWTVPHERRAITAGNRDTHLLLAGSGERKVLFVPGTNFNAGRRLAALAGRRPSWYRKWLTDVLDHIGQGPVVLVGERPEALAELIAG